MAEISVEDMLQAGVHFGHQTKYWNTKMKHYIFVVDAALIYESGADTHMDYVIVITALIKTRMERALARETLSREEILKRMDLQWSEEEKIALADFVIHNDGPEKELIKNITDIYKELV